MHRFKRLSESCDIPAPRLVSFLGAVLLIGAYSFNHIWTGDTTDWTILSIVAASIGAIVITGSILSLPLREVQLIAGLALNGALIASVRGVTETGLLAGFLQSTSNSLFIIAILSVFIWIVDRGENGIWGENHQKNGFWRMNQ